MTLCIERRIIYIASSLSSCTCVDDQFSSGRRERVKRKKEKRYLKIELQFLRNILMNCRAKKWRSVFINDVINQEKKRKKRRKK
jgi:hypothetical protein